VIGLRGSRGLRGWRFSSADVGVYANHQCWVKLPSPFGGRVGDGGSFPLGGLRGLGKNKEASQFN